MKEMSSYPSLESQSYIQEEGKHNPTSMMWDFSEMKWIFHPIIICASLISLILLIFLS